MSKSTTPKKTSNEAAKSPVAYADKDPDQLVPSKNNPSKFGPTSDVDNNVQSSLGTEDGLLKLFTDSVKDIYWAENQLIKALPKMAMAASSNELATAIVAHLEKTKEHAARLEQVFGLLNKKPQARKCDAMEGLTKEGEAIVEDTDPGTAARNVGIIMASQKVEHYEIAAYTGLIKLSSKLGLTDIASLLSQTLAEEQEADQLLGTIADNENFTSDEKE